MELVAAVRDIGRRFTVIAYCRSSCPLGAIAVRILHELSLGILVAEAIGLPLIFSADRARGPHAFAGGEPHGVEALVLRWTGDGGCRANRQNGKGHE